MYPVEYKWIKAEMKVINRHMVIDKGSINSAMSTWSGPTANQL